MAMISMKRVSKKDSEIKEVPALAEEPIYPYGLSIRLEKEELKKLGITDLPSVNQPFMLEGKCIVKSVSAGASTIGGGESEHASVELQLTHLGIESMEEEQAEHDSAGTAKMMYTKMGEKK